MRQKLTAETFRRLLSYDKSSGLFRWLEKTSHRVEVGQVAGCVGKDGYVRIQIAGRKYLCNRLAWLHVTGEWPTLRVDHRDGRPSNNAWLNLRNVTQRVNMQNQRRARSDNGAGLLGAHRQGAGFQSSINIDGSPRYLGYFKTADAAHAAYLCAKRANHVGCTI